MAHVETVEGFVGEGMWFHYDVPADVLYVQLWSHRDRPVVGEETERGILMRDDETDEPVGLTIVNWWKNFGEGSLPESYHELATCIEPFSEQFSAAA